jgi:hypothetical protein
MVLAREADLFTAPLDLSSLKAASRVVPPGVAISALAGPR